MSILPDKIKHTILAEHEGLILDKREIPNHSSAEYWIVKRPFCPICKIRAKESGGWTDKMTDEIAIARFTAYHQSR